MYAAIPLLLVMENRKIPFNSHGFLSYIFKSTLKTFHRTEAFELKHIGCPDFQDGKSKLSADWFYNQSAMLDTP